MVEFWEQRGLLLQFPTPRSGCTWEVKGVNGLVT